MVSFMTYFNVGHGTHERTVNDFPQNVNTAKARGDFMLNLGREVHEAAIVRVHRRHFDAAAYVMTTEERFCTASAAGTLYHNDYARSVLGKPGA